MTSPPKRAIDRSHSMAVRLTHELIFIRDRCTSLEAANKKQVDKRASGGKQMSHEGSLRSLEELGVDLVVEKMKDSDIYLRHMVLQNHQQNLDYPL
ncbi:uncharacterized protein N7484_010239 [Penicillium longicatenatum]|uniref:uncharacterized protein n=1 Tax=Penicillium longicatenatum TaxID=1561947 RepID=UPI00254928E6|nr:uncharacterized protein N7484_010239 [Penicillium longicatenatum]KAJ5636926.1 hypothetical protein N7484_010239 [Penicillium longicatenatum]